MISNRRYISILIIFVTTFILFQGLLLGRIIVSDIHVNKHAGQNALTASQSRKVSDSMKFDDLNSSYSGLKNMSYTLFVGADNSPYIKTVDEWCSYYDKTVLRSGALPELMREIPDTPIYCTKKGEEIIRGHYHADWNFVTVKTGDRLSLGKTELVFIEAPMLHWPDSMFTYLTG